MSDWSKTCAMNLLIGLCIEKIKEFDVVFPTYQSDPTNVLVLELAKMHKVEIN